MKHVILVVAFIGLVGCAPPSSSGHTPIQAVEVGSLKANNVRAITGAFDVWTDGETGCQYLSHYNVGITPRLNPDGTQMCGKDERAAE